MIDVDPRISPEGRAFLEAGIRAGGLVAGPAVPDTFTEGWAVACFVGRGRLSMKAHHWTADRSHAELAKQGTFRVLSACGGVVAVVTKRVPLFGCGNAPMCGQCDRVMLAQMKRRGIGAIKFR